MCGGWLLTCNMQGWCGETWLISCSFHVLRRVVKYSIHALVCFWRTDWFVGIRFHVGLFVCNRRKRSDVVGWAGRGRVHTAAGGGFVRMKHDTTHFDGITMQSFLFGKPRVGGVRSNRIGPLHQLLLSAGWIYMLQEGILISLQQEWQARHNRRIGGDVTFTATCEEPCHSRGYTAREGKHKKDSQRTFRLSRDFRDNALCFS